MKKLLFSLAAATMLFAACTPDTPVNEDPVGTTYPRVQLIEHFTGEDCGYCPYGMDCIDEVYSQNPDEYVWVSNHYGYGKDEYYLNESATIGKKLKVDGAPSISMNRTKLKFDGTSNYSYHPYYTPQAVAKMEKTSTEKVELSRTYKNGKLHVTAKVLTSREDLASVRLTLGVTESGCVGRQADYYGSWNGWTKFTHTHVIRVYATAALGDVLEIKKRAAVAEYDIEMSDKWVAENCQIVAWITEGETDFNVLNAAKLAVVDGTAGGEDIHFGGIEETAVPETYPESGAPVENITFTAARGYYQADNGNTMMVLVAQDMDNAVKTSQGIALYPYTELYLYLEGNQKSIPVGEYPVLSIAEVTPNCVIAGYRNDEEHSLDWSSLYYVYQQNGGLYANAQWLVNTGTLTVTAEGFTLTATTKNGSSFTATYTGAIQCGAMPTNAPAKIQRGEK